MTSKTPTVLVLGGTGKTGSAAHAGAQYSLTGPEALTMSEVAAIITEVGGEPAKHRDVDREAWIQAILDAGVPSDYADTLRFLTETVAASRGSRPTDDVERVTGRPPATFAHFVRQSQRWGGAR